MRHPLTSKERRGLAAVAAAALLCISAGFIVRSCSGGGVSAENAVFESQRQINETDSSSDTVSEKKQNARKEKKQRPKKSGRKNTRSAKKKAPKTYPVRDPLSEPCDE